MEEYYFKGKDITMNPCIQIRDAADIIKAAARVSFMEAVDAFYHSRTYKILQNTENTHFGQNRLDILQTAIMKNKGRIRQ